MLAKTLIDAAVKVCLSKAEVARRIGVHAPELNHLYSGHRVLSPEVAAKLADVAGMDARQAALDAIIERDLRSPTGGRVAEILGKALAAGAVVMWLFCFAVPSISAIESEAVQLTTLYIV